jgi:hypothetical protein
LPSKKSLAAFSQSVLRTCRFLTNNIWFEKETASTVLSI